MEQNFAHRTISFCSSKIAYLYGLALYLLQNKQSKTQTKYQSQKLANIGLFQKIYTPTPIDDIGNPVRNAK